MNDNIFEPSESSRKNSTSFDNWEDYYYKCKLKDNTNKCFITLTPQKIVGSHIKLSDFKSYVNKS